MKMELQESKAANQPNRPRGTALPPRDRVLEAKLLARELLDLACGAHIYVASGLERDCVLFQSVMRDLFGANPSREAVRLHALHLIGECVFYSLAAENPNHPLTQLSAGFPSRARLAEFLTERSLAALQTEAAELNISNL